MLFPKGKNILGCILMTASNLQSSSKYCFIAQNKRILYCQSFFCTVYQLKCHFTILLYSSRRIESMRKKTTVPGAWSWAFLNYNRTVFTSRFAIVEKIYLGLGNTLPSSAAAEDASTIFINPSNISLLDA